MSTGCPNARASFSPIRRDSTSTKVPAANGTTMRTGRVGHAGAWAAGAPTLASASAAATARNAARQSAVARMRIILPAPSKHLATRALPAHGEHRLDEGGLIPGDVDRILAQPFAARIAYPFLRKTA